MNSTKPIQSATPWGLYGAIATLWVWLLIGAMHNGAQLSDNLEHFIWSHSFQWGYWKHPPLPTWLVYGLNHAFGPNARWTYVLAGLCFTVTLVATYRIAQHLFDRHAASVVAMIISLHLGFTRGAQLYNHNTVMLSTIALTVWAALWAVQRGRLGWWVLVGLLAGLSMLAKYQSAFPLLGIVLAIALSPDRRRLVAGVLIAVAVALCVMTPHFVWLMNAPATPLQYAMGYVGDDPAQASRWMRMVEFVLRQLHYYLPLIVFMALAVVYQLSRQRLPTFRPVKPFDPTQKAWMIGLLALPLSVMVVMALVFGVQIQSPWGLQALQFLPVFIAPWVMKKVQSVQPVSRAGMVGHSTRCLDVLGGSKSGVGRTQP
ncbi:MAG: glycosyltransferase family 39 protein [Alphaproteobacteria bacterium]|nr:glycosyltransferase family 39 protein [Alphaproteobacteria bacterium]